MADLIRLTEDWTTITANSTQPIQVALDVQKYDILDFVLTTGIDSTGSPVLTVNLLTGMSLLSPSAWVKIPGATVSVSTDRLTTVVPFPTVTGGFYRYLLWQATVSGLTTARFLIEGVGRSYR